MEKKLSIFVLAIAGFLLCSCAAMKPQVINDLERQGIEVKQATKLPGQVIVLQEHDASGLTVEYGVLKYRSEGKNRSKLEYIDPELRLVLDDQDILVYFKLDVYNPTHELLEMTYEIIKNGKTLATVLSGGNVPNSSFYFYVPIPLKDQDIKARVLLRLKNSPTYIETRQLKCVFEHSRD